MLESSGPERIPFPPLPEINRVTPCQGCASFPALVGISLLSCCLLSLQEVKATASSKMMLGWLKNSQEASPKKKENELPRWTSQFIHSPSPKKSSADILQQWLGKEGEPAAKKRKV